MRRDHQGRVALVTGAAQGMGAACARRLAAGGAAVAVFDRQAEPLQELATELDGLACPGDVTRAADVERAVAAAVDRHGRLDILVNAAGIMLRTRFFELEEDEFDRVVAVSLKGSFLVSKAVAGPMREGGFGRIVHFSSTAAAPSAPWAAAITRPPSTACSA